MATPIESPHGHSYDCLCTICDCGRHECPPTPIFNQTSFGNNVTDYQANFVGRYAAPKRVTKRSIEHPRHDSYVSEPFKGMSTQKMDYQWFSNVPRTRSARPQSAVSASDYHRTRIPFRGESTHGADFLHWDSTRTRSVKGTATIHQRNIEQPYLSETRNFVTENSAKYNQKSLSKRAKERKKSMRPQTAGTQRIYQTRSLPFEGQSTNQADFQHWSRAKPARPTKTTRNIRLKKIRDGRSFVTENTSMYRKHRHRLCPAKALGTQTKSCSGHLMVVGNGRGGYKFKQRNGFR